MEREKSQVCRRWAGFRHLFRIISHSSRSEQTRSGVGPRVDSRGLLCITLHYSSRIVSVLSVRSLRYEPIVGAGSWTEEIAITGYFARSIPGFLILTSF